MLGAQGKLASIQILMILADSKHQETGILFKLIIFFSLLVKILMRQQLAILNHLIGMNKLKHLQPMGEAILNHT